MAMTPIPEKRRGRPNGPAGADTTAADDADASHGPDGTTGACEPAAAGEGDGEQDGEDGEARQEHG